MWRSRRFYSIQVASYVTYVRLRAIEDGSKVYLKEKEKEREKKKNM